MGPKLNIIPMIYLKISCWNPGIIFILGRHGDRGIYAVALFILLQIGFQIVCTASNIQELLENLHRVYTHEQSGASGPSTAVSQDHTLEQERSHVSPSGDAVEHNEQSCSSRKTTGESAGESQNPNQRIQTLIQRFLYSHSAPVPSQ